MVIANQDEEYARILCKILCSFLRFSGDTISVNDFLELIQFETFGKTILRCGDISFINIK